MKRTALFALLAVFIAVLLSSHSVSVQPLQPTCASLLKERTQKDEQLQAFARDEYPSQSGMEEWVVGA
jgi:hypothetical protein